MADGHSQSVFSERTKPQQWQATVKRLAFDHWIDGDARHEFQFKQRLGSVLVAPPVCRSSAESLRGQHNERIDAVLVLIGWFRYFDG